MPSGITTRSRADQQRCARQRLIAMHEQAIDISIVIPVYNSSDCVGALARQLTAVLDDMGRPYEVILVDDASPDDSWAVIRRIVTQYPGFTGIQLMTNSGQAQATLCGLACAKGDIIVTMDDDLQHRPSHLPRLVGALESDSRADCAFGVHPIRHQKLYRQWGSCLVRRINAHAFNIPVGASYSSFRAMRAPVARVLVSHRTQSPTISPMVFACTTRVVSVELDHAPRYAGSSNYTLTKQLRLAIDNICNVSFLPLRAVSALGLSAFVLSAVLIVHFLYRYMAGRTGVAGWTTTVILLSFFSGAILLSLGIIGEYLVRVLREVRGSPTYVIRDRVGHNACRAAADRTNASHD